MTPTTTWTEHDIERIAAAALIDDTAETRDVRKATPDDAGDDSDEWTAHDRSGAVAVQPDAPRHFESRVTNGGVLGGALAMLGATVWFVGGLMNDLVFFYPPVLFVLGLVAVFRGLAHQE